VAVSLQRCLRDPSWDVRRAAALALRGLGPVGEVLLRRALRDEDRFARDIATLALDLPEAVVSA
jgi:HEAT repeat protein